MKICWKGEVKKSFIVGKITILERKYSLIFTLKERKVREFNVAVCII